MNISRVKTLIIYIYELAINSFKVHYSLFSMTLHIYCYDVDMMWDRTINRTAYETFDI